jgi:hypothetical protein
MRSLAATKAVNILARPQFDPRKRLLAFNVETNKATYLAANGDRREGDTPAALARIKTRAARAE